MTYLREDYLAKIKDPELKQELEAKNTTLEKKIYRQFIPFIDSEISQFAWQNSPLEKNQPVYKLDIEELKDYFDHVRHVVLRLKISSDECTEFLIELDRLREKLERYQAEPSLYSFEKIEAELQQKIHQLVLNNFFARSSVSKALDYPETHRKNQLEFDLLLAEAHLLNEIADEMINVKMRAACQARSKSFLRAIEDLKIKNNIPRELLSMEARLQELLRKTQAGEAIEDDDLKIAELCLAEIKAKTSDNEHGKILERLFRLVERIKGKFVDKDTEDDLGSGIDWAWSLLEVPRTASMKTIKEAYRKLSFQYHPDRNKKIEAAEMIRRINEAFELIKRMEELKTIPNSRGS